MRRSASDARIVPPARSRAGAATEALLHNLAMICGVLWLGWSVSFLLVAAWVEMLCLALALRVMVGRSRHGGELADPSDASIGSSRPPPTLRRQSSGLIAAVLALGTFLAFGGATLGGGPDALGPMWWWAGGDPRVVVAVGVLGAALALRPSWRALRHGGLTGLRRAHDRQSTGVAHALLILIVVPWTILIGGATLLLIAFFAARAASDYWLARQPQ